MAIKKVALLTAGGLAPCLSTAIGRLIERYTEISPETELIAYVSGYKGLLLGDSIQITEEIRQNAAILYKHGGSPIGNSRVKLTNVKDCEKRGLVQPGENPLEVAASQLVKDGIDVLHTIGGDDTLGFSARLHDEGVPVVAIPKTMDNDVHGTDYCIGFSTAVTRGVDFIQNLRTSTGSHERIAVIELFGRYSGETSLLTAYLAGVDRAVISEVPVDVEKLAGLLAADRAANPSKYAMVTISEGAVLEGGEMMLTGEADAYGHRKLGGIGAELGEEIKRITGYGIILQQLGYLMRSGSPDSLDLMVAINFAAMATDLAMEGSSGRMVALRGGTYTNVPISVIGEGVRRVDVDELYDIDEYRPKVRHVGGKPMFLY